MRAIIALSVIFSCASVFAQTTQPSDQEARQWWADQRLEKMGMLEQLQQKESDLKKEIALMQYATLDAIKQEMSAEAKDSTPPTTPATPTTQPANHASATATHQEKPIRKPSDLAGLSLDEIRSWTSKPYLVEADTSVGGNIWVVIFGQTQGHVSTNHGAYRLVELGGKIATATSVTPG